MIRFLSHLVFLVLVPLVTAKLAWSEDFSVLEEPRILQNAALHISSAKQLGIEANLYLSLPAAPSEQPEFRDRQQPFALRGIGSAKKLMGNVCVDHVFLDSPDVKWTPQKRGESLAARSAAFRRLQEMADSRGIALQFTEVQRVFESDSVFPIASFSHSLLREYIAPPLFFDSAELERCPIYPCDQKIQMVHVAKVGHSFALAKTRGSTTWMDDEVESVVVYLRRRQVGYYYDPEVEIAEIEQVDRPAVFAHEVLHLFGAEDLYSPIARKAIAEAGYASDIMLQTNRLLETITIDAYTSYLIGWSTIVPPQLP
ncbi:MAG: hypothetical protein JKY56_06380 [Kofleriaceae bacterium]|nr:hypothetical protein [Kofleriaceae bacterium]